MLKMIEKPLKARAKVYKDGDSLEIYLPSKKSWLKSIKFGAEFKVREAQALLKY